MDTKQNPFSFYDFLGYLIPGAVFLYGVLLMLGHLDANETSFSFVEKHLSFEKSEIYIPFILLAYITGHFLAFISSITIERYSLWAHGYPSKYLLGIKHASYFSAKEKVFLRFVMRLIVGFLLAPISILDWLLGKELGLYELYAKPLDPLLIAVLRSRIDSLIIHHGQIEPKEEYGSADELDFFRYAYHFAVENAPNHLSKMQNYVALYGFLRTLTLISLIAFWILLWHIVNLKSFGLTAAIILIASISFLTYMIFMAFVKFYRRFSLEALMAMAVTYQFPPIAENAKSSDKK